MATGQSPPPLTKNPHVPSFPSLGRSSMPDVEWDKLAIPLPGKVPKQAKGPAGCSAKPFQRRLPNLRLPHHNLQRRRPPHAAMACTSQLVHSHVPAAAAQLQSSPKTCPDFARLRLQSPTLPEPWKLRSHLPRNYQLPRSMSIPMLPSASLQNAYDAGPADSTMAPCSVKSPGSLEYQLSQQHTPGGSPHDPPGASFGTVVLRAFAGRSGSAPSAHHSVASE